MKISFNIESDDEIKDVTITVNKSNGNTSTIKVKEGERTVGSPIVIPTPLAPPSPLIERISTPDPFVQTSISGDAGSINSGNGGMDETY